jgi:hypothetical protein
MPARIEWTGQDRFRAALLERAVKASAASKEACRLAGHELEALAKRNASGRPGPNVVSGALRREIRAAPAEKVGDNWMVRVKVLVPYARRIELGFKGPDKLGRVYNQPPFPYVAPAYRAVKARFNEIYAATCRAMKVT